MIFFYPKEHTKEHLAPVTRKEIEVRGHDEISLGEFLGCFGCFLFILEPIMRNAMSGKRFDRIDECLKLYYEEDASEQSDRLFWIRKTTKGFNDNMAAEFNHSWLVCGDECMVAFHNAHTPVQTCLDRKPHPLGNEHHETACCETRIIFSMELVGGKDKPLEGTHASPEF